jgi:hypothetical protein
MFYSQELVMFDPGFCAEYNPLKLKGWFFNTMKMQMKSRLKGEYDSLSDLGLAMSVLL